MISAVPEEMVDAIAVARSPDEVRARLAGSAAQRYDDVRRPRRPSNRPP